MWNDDDGGGGGAGGAPETAPAPAPAWHSGLTTELRDEGAIRPYVERNDLNGMATRLVDAERRLGARGLAVPGADAGEEEWGAVWDALGRPAKPEEYRLRLPEGYEPTELERAAHPKIQALYHRAGLTARQAETLQEGWAEVMTDFNQQLTQLEEASSRFSQAEIARRYPDRRLFEADRHAGLRFAAGGDEDLIEALQGMRLQTGGAVLDHPSFQVLLARVGGALNEDQRGPGAAGRGAEHRYSSANDIDAELNRTYAAAANDPAHPLHPQSTAPPAERQRAQDRVVELTEMKHRKRA